MVGQVDMLFVHCACMELSFWISLGFKVIKLVEGVFFLFICKLTSMDMNNWKDQRAFFVYSDSEILIQGIGNTCLV